MEILRTILVTLGFSFALALALGVALGFFREKFKVERNPLIDKARAILPGVNCGACGYAGCDAYAEAVVEKKEKANLCTSGGAECADSLGKLLGVSAGKVEDMVAVLRCKGTTALTVNKGEYSGVRSCRAAKLSTGGIKRCPWGCMGFGDCVSVCAFGALSMGPEGLPVVDYSKCTGCGMCDRECPQTLFIMAEKSRRGSLVLCSNKTDVKQSVAKACKAGCIKCEICVKACPKSAIKMMKGLPTVDYALCDSCGICVQKCPVKVLALIEERIRPS
jgi:Na+-translocating ferredoxin:NAD+ oxidoreductase RNF subunit RnfB